jgi:hypothetical protein
MFRLLNSHHQAFLKIFCKNYRVGAHPSVTCVLRKQIVNTRLKRKISSILKSNGVEECPKWGALQLHLMTKNAWISFAPKLYVKLQKKLPCRSSRRTFVEILKLILHERAKYF